MEADPGTNLAPYRILELHRVALLTVLRGCMVSVRSVVCPVEVLDHQGPQAEHRWFLEG